MRAALTLVLCGLLATCGRPVVDPSPSLAVFERLTMLEASKDWIDWRIDGSTERAALARLRAWADAEEIIVTTVPLDRRELLGAAIPTRSVGWTVFVNSDESIDGQFYTLVHELAHVYQPDGLQVGQAETFAEVIAVQVAARCGLQVWPQTAAYLRAHATSEQQFWTLQAHAREMDRLVDKLSRAAS